MIDIKVKVTSDTKRWNGIKRKILQGNNYSNRVGWIKPKYHKSERSQNILISQIAKWCEEGHTSLSNGKYVIIPPRPFIRVGFIMKIKSSPIIRQKLARNLYSVSVGQMSWNSFYKDLGEDLVKLMMEVINEWNSPQNSPYTVKLKGFNNPLVETGLMRDSVEFDVFRG